MNDDLMRILIVISILIFLIIAGCIIFGFWMFDFALVRKKQMDFDAGDELLPHMDVIRYRVKEANEIVNTFPRENIHIRSFDGLLLNATFIPSEYFSRKVVITVHGYNSYGLFDTAPILPYYHSMGYNVIVVDNRSHGKSEGKFIGFGWLDRMDILNWCRYAIQRFGKDCEIVLHGVSMGAATVLMTSGESALPSQVKGVIADCPFAGAYEEFGYLMRHNYHVPGKPLLYFASMVCKLRAGYSFRDCSTAHAVRNINIPVLFIHGTEDEFVPPYMTKKMYNICHSSYKELYMCEGATHVYSAFQDFEAYENRVGEFIYQIESMNKKD